MVYEGVKRRKVPGTYKAEVGDSFRVEIATGGDPQKALTVACLKLQDELGLKVGVIDLAVMHDDGCPCTEPPKDKDISHCTCELLWLDATRIG